MTNNIHGFIKVDNFNQLFDKSIQETEKTPNDDLMQIEFPTNEFSKDFFSIYAQK